MPTNKVPETREGQILYAAAAMLSSTIAIANSFLNDDRQLSDQLVDTLTEVAWDTDYLVNSNGELERQNQDLMNKIASVQAASRVTPELINVAVQSLTAEIDVDTMPHSQEFCEGVEWMFKKIQALTGECEDEDFIAKLQTAVRTVDQQQDEIKALHGKRKTLAGRSADRGRRILELQFKITELNGKLKTMEKVHLQDHLIKSH